jgi:hypothetical protein
MNTAFKSMTLAFALCAAGVAYADAPADAPAGTNGLCKDGTYSSNATKKGACKGHKGVKEWYAATDTKTKEMKSKDAAPAKSEAAPAAAAAPAPAPATAPAKAASKAAAPGGGPGLVWVNSSSKVYHCQGDEWYGKTKQGEYMAEADAKSKGNRPAGGKSCS